MAGLQQVAFKLYEILPRSVVRLIGQSALLKPLRDAVLRKNKVYRSIAVGISKEFVGYRADFQFVAGLKVAERAKRKGIENSLLRDSIQLLKTTGTVDRPYIFDIGANYGYLSLVWASTVCATGGKVFSFEPNPNLASAFRSSVQINNFEDVITSENMAVGEESGTTELFLRTTSSNMKRVPESESSIFIELTCIDDYIEKHSIQKCSLIKIDTDGTELEILRGASRTIDRFAPILIIETNQDRRILHFLHDKGYVVQGLDLTADRSSQVLPLNILCVKASA